MTIPLATVARHEAAHAVVALARGCIAVWAYASIEGGETRFGVPDDIGWRDAAAAVAMAGSLAAGHPIGPSDARILASTGLPTHEIAEIERRTVALIELYEPAIVAVTARLIADRRLTGLAIKRAALQGSPCLRGVAVPLRRGDREQPPALPRNRRPPPPATMPLRITVI